jgi:hypothetical protein
VISCLRDLNSDQLKLLLWYLYQVFNFYNLQDFMEDLWDRMQILSRNAWKVKSGMSVRDMKYTFSYWTSILLSFAQ